MADADTPPPPYPLYNRTYQLFRLSPLYHGDGPLLDERVLRSHAKRLREQLKGDSVRGVEVDYAGTEGALPGLGPLEECDWDVLGDENAWISRYVHVDSSQLSSAADAPARGIVVNLEYERQSYNAVLYRDPENTSSPDGFTALPLLLVKMPAPVRDVFLNYLRIAFDAHVAPLKLPSTYLTSVLEKYFDRLSAATSSQSIQHVIRQLHLQLSFPQISTVLKHVDISISSSDIARFVSSGKLRNPKESPFTVALTSYLKKHLALDLTHPKVHVSRVSCYSFTLGSDRFKLVAPDRESTSTLSASELAAQDFVTSLVREATGTGKFLPDDFSGGLRSSTPSSTTSARDGRRKRAVSTTATGNANAKRSKPRGKENGKRPNGDEEMVDV
ncbi:hypothetical protein BS50DRAFT_282171 [Corynespora cassiicola Philippines]|uniref:Kinetochore complex Sim4 subunit Fta1-domain-containing protein n=1 Tax=Corynespora cassiicola Philippines TaxID=1448308 RepID=A0A2T2P214_CORCC|nr:hypothetical protein BS50DRAFT_282171 [Corynespora cassiicola Philippines]